MANPFSSYQNFASLETESGALVGDGQVTLAAILVAALATYATDTALEGYRWRNDDGSELTATWKELQDINLYLVPGEMARLRVAVVAPIAGDFQWEFAEEGTEDWRKLVPGP